MRIYSNIITLVKNSRGVWDLDTIKGCKYGTQTNPNGCYDSCYAVRLSKRSGIAFSKSVKRDFESENHLHRIISKLKNIDMQFVRIGISGDPSEDWEHTINICEKIKPANKSIVIITKHWRTIPDMLLDKIKGICINTSISALDSDVQIRHRLAEYNRLKPYCNSVLRVNTCNFNMNNLEGAMLDKIQQKLLNNNKVLDTILRFNKNHDLVKARIVHLDYTKYLNSNVYASINNKSTYFSKCDECPEMCGINLIYFD